MADPLLSSFFLLKQTKMIVLFPFWLIFPCQICHILTYMHQDIWRTSAAPAFCYSSLSADVEFFIMLRWPLSYFFLLIFILYLFAVLSCLLILSKFLPYLQLCRCHLQILSCWFYFLHNLYHWCQFCGYSKRKRSTSTTSPKYRLAFSAEKESLSKQQKKQRKCLHRMKTWHDQKHKVMKSKRN